MNSGRTWFALLLMSVVYTTISGCSLLSREPVEKQAIAERQQQLLALSDWIAAGRIVLESKGQATNVAMRWDQEAADYGITLTGPLGMRLLQAEQSETVATLQVRGGRPVRGKSLEAMVQHYLNVPVPMGQLSFWLRGLPGDGVDPVWDEYGRLQSLAYRDNTGVEWKARFTRYSLIDTLELPVMIEAKGGPNDIAISIRNWTLTPEKTPAEPNKPAPEPKPGNRLTIPGVS